MMVTITVSGPGKGISYEMEIIRRFLESEGYKVTVKDEHPFIPDDPTCSEFSSWEEYQAHRRRLLSPDYERNSAHNQITLVSDHQPWGG